MSETIFITGAAKGIGRACARRFAAAGWTVGLFDIDEPGLASLADELIARHGSAAVCWRRLDVSDGASIDAGLQHFSDHCEGRLDVLLNNAGIMRVGPFEQLELADHRRMLAINAQGLLEVAYKAFPLLRDTKGARLINLSSASAIYGMPELASYGATKHFVRGLTEALEIEWRRHDIAVCDVMPIYVDTDLVSGTARARSLDRLGMHLVADDVAEVVWRAAHARGRAFQVHWPVGLQTRVAMAAQRMSPRRLERLVVKLISGH